MTQIIGLALVGVLSFVLAAPVHADGERGSGFQGGQSGMHGMGVRPPSGFQHNGGFQHRNHVHRGCCWGNAFFGWPVAGSVLAGPYSPYPYSYPAYPDPVYLPVPAYQPQQQVYLAPPAQSELCYIGGCYRLRGDGMSDPFRWVWIPTVPEGPPAPPNAPPAVRPAPAPADPASSRPTQHLYRWIDEQGVANWTNNREAVPERYRAQLNRSL